MFLTLKYHFKPTQYQYKLLKLLFHISKNIYNSALYELRSQFFDNKKICSYFDLNKIMKHNYLHYGINNTNIKSVIDFSTFLNFHDLFLEPK